MDVSQYKARAPGHRDVTNRLFPGPPARAGWNLGAWGPFVAGGRGIRTHTAEAVNFLKIRCNNIIAIIVVGYNIT